MQDKKMPKVQVHNLTKKFGDLLVLNDISFDVRSGEFLCIVGPTGCGKTTFLNSLTKLYEPTAGEILLDGEPVNLKKHNIAYIFQEYSTTVSYTHLQKYFDLSVVVTTHSPYFVDAINLFSCKYKTDSKMCIRDRPEGLHSLLMCLKRYFRLFPNFLRILQVIPLRQKLVKVQPLFSSS